MIGPEQRWRDRRDSYRPADDERFDPRYHEVVRVDRDRDVRPFIVQHHYSGTLPNSSSYRYLLIDTRRPYWAGKGGVVGAITFGQPGGPQVLRSSFPFLDTPSRESCELQRLVLLDEVKRNAESWFVAQAMRHHERSVRAEGVEAVVSFSDPVPRWDRDGLCVMPGHVGTIYQALTAWYTGRSKPRSAWCVRETGHVLNDRDLSKIRASQRSGKSTSGWEGAVERLKGYGARPPEEGEDLVQWLVEVLDTVCARQRHGGNHRYKWGLTRAAKRGLRQLHGAVDHTVYPKAADPTERPPWTIPDAEVACVRCGQQARVEGLNLCWPCLAGGAR